MFNIILFQPEIPPNTGNIIRLCANTGCHLHLIKPLGFELEDKKLRRAGLDYHEWANVETHESIDAIQTINTGNVYAISTRGVNHYDKPRFKKGDTFVFGPETRGLPQDYLDGLNVCQILRLPMLAQSRSLNLSNTVSVVVYEGLRQMQFIDLA